MNESWWASGALLKAGQLDFRPLFHKIHLRASARLRAAAGACAEPALCR